MFKSKEIHIKSSLSELYKVEEFVETISDVFNVNNNYYSTILISLDEAVRNAIEHGNKFDVNKDVIISFKSAFGSLVFSVKDSGDGFDYNELYDPISGENSLEKETGKGLFLMIQLSDDLKFNEERNEVTLYFKISGINKELSVQRNLELNSYFKEHILTVNI